MRKLFWIFLLLYAVAGAEVLQTGQIYTGPLKLTAENLGASFRLPQGYRAQLVTERGPLVLQSVTDEDRILIEANVSVSGNPLSQLSEKQDYYGLRLFSPTQIKRMRPSLYYRLYQVEASDEFDQGLVYLVLGTQGRAVRLYGFFRPGGYDRMRQTMMTLSDSVSFTAIRMLPRQTSLLSLQLANGHFVFYERRASFSEKRELWLCRNGEARLKGTYPIANNTSRTTLSRLGKWRVDDDMLMLDFSDGTRARYHVSKEENTLYFDKAQTFRLPNNACERRSR